MRKFLLLILTSMMTVYAMGIGRNDGSTKANAIDFDWSRGVEHEGGTKWYRVDLAPLYEEENPSLALYLTNPSNVVGSSVKVSMVATVGGETESKEYTIAARQYKSYTANASLLIRMNQTDIYLTLNSTGAIKLSAKVFEASDLDENCKDARTLEWNTETEQPRTYSAWWRVDLKPVKEAPTQNKDAKITITNTGSGEVFLRMGQSLDCPSSGLTKRTFILAAGESVVDTVPRSMIMSVQPDELYFSVENIEEPVSMKVELIDQPEHPIIPATASYVDLHVTDKKTLQPGTQLYRISVAEMRDTVKYEPEFTYRNLGETTANVSVKMAFSLPAHGTDNINYTLAPNGEEVVVYKKNMLEGLDEEVKYFYLLISVDQPILLSGRFKHIREGKACKTNIDFNWDEGHHQEARTTQWYAVEIGDANANLQDIVVYIQNEGSATATVKASLAFSCPYVDVQEVTRTIAANSEPVSRKLKFSSYAMMPDTVWIGLETNQNIRFWAETEDAQWKDPDPACMLAQIFNWEEGALQKADTTIWYKFAMEEVREQSAKFPTIFVQNYGDAPANITAEISLECPDDIENDTRTMTIAPNGSYSKKLSRNLFENVIQDTIYVCVTSTQEIAIQVRLTEKPAGSDCSAAIPFNWVSGNTQDANTNLWYKVDLTNVMRRGNDLKFHIENKANSECNGVAQLAYCCPIDVSPSIFNFKLAGKGVKDMTLQNSTFETIEDSAIYINLQATATLHFWADTMTVEPFDTIYADGITLIPLRWDTLYTQTVDTAWYVISREEIEKVQNLSDRVKPVGHFINLATDSNTIKAEMAFAFPIVKNMITRSKALGKKQRGSDTIPATTFEQVLKKDSILLRLTRTPGAGDFQFRAELVSAYTGNTRYDALPLAFGKVFEQEANTDMWYKIDIKEWKKNQDLHGRSLHFNMKNHGRENAEITESLYDGLLSEADIFEDFGNTGSRTIKAGQSVKRSMAAHMLYGMSDLELYLKIHTTQKISFFPSLGDAEPAPEDPNQQKAKLLVPEVDYLVPQDNTVWFRACIEYLKTNYILTDSTSFVFHHEGVDSAKVIMSIAFQDTVRFKLSERTRLFAQNDTLTYKELTDEMLKKMGINFSVEDTKTEFLDSLIRRFSTDDHVAMQIRMLSSEPLYMRMINAPQIRGQWMRNAILFDWEHGNVNPQDQSNWFRAVVTKDRIPEGKDLRLHVTNWSDQPCTATAKIHLDSLPDSKPKSKSYTLAPYEDKWQDIGREALAGSSDLMIDYYSDFTSHIWAEIVEARPRGTVIADTVMVACDGETLLDPYTSIPWKVDFSDQKTLYRKDSIPFINDTLMAEWDSICYIRVRERIDPSIYEIEEIPVASLPVVTKGAVIDYRAADAWLRAKLEADKAANDTIEAIEDILWERSINNENDAFEPISLITSIDTTAQVIRYRMVTECDDDTLESDLYYYTVRDTLTVSACGSYRWIVKNAAGYSVKDKTYTSSTNPLDSVRLTLENGCTRWAYLQLTIHHDMLTEEVYDTVCAAQLPYLWNEGTYAEAGEYPYSTANAAGCDSTVTLHLTVLEETSEEVYDTVCAARLPYLWNDGSYAEAGDYPYSTTNAAGCDSLVTLHLTVWEATTGEVYDTVCAALLPYLWNEGSYAEAGDYLYTTTNVAGCDSLVTLHLTVSEGVVADTTATECNLFTWYGETYYASGDYTYETLTAAGCDSIVTLHLTINNPYTATLELIHKYGDRLLLINRTEINSLSREWDLDVESDTALVEWYRVATPEDVFLGYGYYLTNIDGDANGEKIQPGQTYYAKIDIPGTEGNCGYKAETVRYTTAASRQAPALIPSLARPGQEITVHHLNPEAQTLIRIYTTEGLLQHSYTLSGEESFVIKAADAHGFYLVEIVEDNMKSIVRYIVK